MKMTLLVKVELDVADDIEVETVCEAICNQFTGIRGEGLRQWSGAGEVISPTHNIEITDQTDLFNTTIWGSSKLA